MTDITLTSLRSALQILWWQANSEIVQTICSNHLVIYGSRWRPFSPPSSIVISKIVSQAVCLLSWVSCACWVESSSPLHALRPAGGRLFVAGWLLRSPPSTAIPKIGFQLLPFTFLSTISKVDFARLIPRYKVIQHYYSKFRGFPVPMNVPITILQKNWSCQRWLYFADAWCL